MSRRPDSEGGSTEDRPIIRLRYSAWAGATTVGMGLIFLPGPARLAGVALLGLSTLGLMLFSPVGEKRLPLRRFLGRFSIFGGGILLLAMGAAVFPLCTLAAALPVWAVSLHQGRKLLNAPVALSVGKSERELRG